MMDSSNPYASPETESPALPAVDRRFRIYWGFGSIPELADLPKKEQRRLWRRYCWSSFGHWQTWLAVLGMGVFGAIPGLLVPALDAAEFPAPLFFVLSGVAGGIGGFFYSQVFTAMARPYLREARERGELGGPEEWHADLRAMGRWARTSVVLLASPVDAFRVT